ncbi:MAG: acetyl-CoA carboxylase biotin carboxyl carrier protein [Rhodospirillaceae bacterium]|nr:acetyl-CoA carboxylase biotin carboxyl carrier protein [Rhodospirillaceae bacterium]
MAQIDGDSVKQLAAILAETGLTEIEYDIGSIRIRVARNVTGAPVYAPAHAPAAAGPATQAAAPAPADAASNPGCLKSPMVGVVYLSPEPGAAPFVKIGDQINEGQTVVLIEAMKTFNQVKAHRTGRVTQILVTDKNPVEYGEPLLVIE